MDWRCATVVALVVPVAAQVAEIPLTRLKPDAVIAVALGRGAHASADGIWIHQPDTRSVVHVVAKNNTAEAPVMVGRATCASLLMVANELWTATCDDPALIRVHMQHRNVSASMPLPIARPEGRIAIAAHSLWVITDTQGIISRVDHATQKAVAEVYVAHNPASIAAEDEAVWVTSEEGNLLTRINAQTNAIVETIAVGPRPGPLAIGEDAVWTLNRGDGSVSRVDPKSNKLVKTIAVAQSVADGDIAVGEGAVWISAVGAPLVRIDPRTNRVTHRFSGAGGGAVLVAHGSVWVNAVARTTWRIDPKLVAAMRPD